MEADRDLMPPPSLMGPPKIAPKSKLPTESKTVETTPSKQEESPAPPTPPPLLYEVPFWDSKPIHKYQLEVLKNGTIVETLDIFDKGASTAQEIQDSLLEEEYLKSGKCCCVIL